MAILKMILGQTDTDWREFRIELPVARLGRPSLDSVNEVLFRDQAVSRKHAKILKEDGEYFIVDRGSRAGTFINGLRLLPGEPHRLENRDSIRICKYLLVFLEGIDEKDSQISHVEVSQIGESTGFSAILDGSSSSVLKRVKVNPEAKLEAIIELTQQLRKGQDLETVLATTLDCLLKVFPVADRGVVVLPASERQLKQVGLVQYRASDAETEAVVSGQVLEDVAKQNVTALLPDETTMCTSLAGHDDKSLGVIQLDTALVGACFTDGDLDLFATLATVVAFAVDNWILHAVAIRDHNTRIELQVATEVQIGLLPKSAPDIQGYEFFDFYSPAKEVGGDYFDYLQLDEKHLVVVLGDVSGKGIPAAILMAKVSSEINALLNCGLTPLDVMNRVNARFANRGPDGRFVTMVLAAIDLETHAVTLVNAGHMLPLLRHADDSMVEVGKGYSGMPLGVLPEHEYQESHISLEPGDTLVLFSDGVTDASNADKLMFGMDRFRSAYDRAQGTAMQVGKSIMREIHQHVGHEPQTDDICLLCISRLT